MTDPSEMHIVRITYDNGTYLGDFIETEDGVVENGIGMFVWKNGDRYEGEYLKGMRQGMGMLVRADGIVYHGEFENDMRHGHGKMTWPDGTEYNGDFENGEMHGKGMLKWPSGEVYIGWFRNGKMHGNGTHYAQDGTVIYEGEWYDNGPFIRMDGSDGK